MRAYLARGRPLSPRLNRWARERDWATAAIGWGALLLECALVPATLALPPGRGRAAAAGAMIVMHVARNRPPARRLNRVGYSELLEETQSWCASAVHRDTQARRSWSKRHSLDTSMSHRDTQARRRSCSVYPHSLMRARFSGGCRACGGCTSEWGTIHRSMF